MSILVEKELYTPVPGTVVVDLSWVMYRSHYAMPHLSVTDLAGNVIPTAHVHETLLTIAQISSIAPRVIIAVDSKCPFRFKIFPEYKGNRHKDPNEFNIKVHTNLILAIASRLPNVTFMKKEDFEADDLINHVIASGDEPTVFGSDNDLMQVPKPFKTATSVIGNELGYIDRAAYISKKYSISGVLHLPVWYKTVRGDPSDNLPSGCPRFPSKLLTPLCQDLEDTMEWKDFEDYIDDPLNKGLSKLSSAKDVLFRNYQIVSPRPVLFEDGPLWLKKLKDSDASQQLLGLQCFAVIQYFQVLGVSLV